MRKIVISLALASVAWTLGVPSQGQTPDAQTAREDACVAFHLVASPEDGQRAFAAIDKQFPELGHLFKAEEHTSEGSVFIEREPAAGAVAEATRKSVEDILSKARQAGLIPEDILPLLSAKPEVAEQDQLKLYCLKSDPNLAVRTVKKVTVSPDKFSKGHWNLLLEFDDATAQRFGEFTQSHINQRLAIVHGREVLSAPVIRAQITSHCMITGQFTQKQAEAIAAALRGTGAETDPGSGA